MSIKVQAAILEQDVHEVQRKIHMLDGLFPDVQLDVMDGHFVPNTTVHDPIVIEGLDWGTLKIDLHLMIENPELNIKKWALPNVQAMMIHFEAAHNVAECIELIHKYNKQAVLVINPHTPTYDIQEYIPQLEGVMVMGVEPGFAAQAFNSDVLQKITHLREQYPELTIYVDGGVNESTKSGIIKAGASVLCANSYLFNAADITQAAQTLATP